MNNNITLGFANIIHAHEIAQIELMCFSLPWSEKAICDFLRYDYNKILCAFFQNKVVGYISFSLVCGECSIENVAVNPSFRKQGIASLIIDGLLEYLKKHITDSVFLEVRASNIPALNLYTKYGFTRCGIRKGFYSKPPEDALLMSLNLTQKE